jgi:hypothetical protein
MSEASSYRWVALLLSAAVLITGCATVPPVPGVGSRLGYGRNEHVPGTRVALASPSELAARTVVGGAVRVDAFEELLTFAGLDCFSDLPPRDAPLSPQEATRVLSVLLAKPVTLASLPPRMAAGHLLREVLEGGEVSRAELLRRVERFKSVAVLRPDGYLAWTLTGRTQQKVGPVAWRDETFRAGPFELGRFYVGNGWVFRKADARLRPIREGPPLAEVYDDADYLGRTLDGAEEAYVELYHSMGQLLTHPWDSLVGLRHLPAGVVALLASSPEYLERLRYMTRGEQVKALSKLTTSLLVTFGAAGGTTSTLTRTVGGVEAAVPVLSLSAEGLLVVERVAVPVGKAATVLGSGPWAAIILQQAGTDSTNRPRSPHRTPPRIEDGNMKEGWQHIEARHITGQHPNGPGDLFAPGTTRQQLVEAAKEIVEQGTRISRPGDRIQSFQMKLKINGRRALVQVVVDSDDANRVITLFPIKGGG